MSERYLPVRKKALIKEVNRLYLQNLHLSAKLIELQRNLNPAEASDIRDGKDKVIRDLSPIEIPSGD